MVPFIIENRKRGEYFGSIRTDKDIMCKTGYQRFGIGEVVWHKSAGFYSENEKGNFYSGRVERSGKSCRV